MRRASGTVRAVFGTVSDIPVRNMAMPAREKVIRIRRMISEMTMGRSGHRILLVILVVLATVYLLFEVLAGV